MKFLIIFAFVSFVSAASIRDSDGDNEKFAEKIADHIIGTCRTQFNVTVEESEEIDNNEESDPSEALQCFANCFLEKFSIIDNGIFQEEFYELVFTSDEDEEKTKKVISECRGQKGSNNCETGYKLLSCLLKND